MLHRLIFLLYGTILLNDVSKELLISMLFTSFRIIIIIIAYFYWYKAELKTDHTCHYPNKNQKLFLLSGFELDLFLNILRSKISLTFLVLYTTLTSPFLNSSSMLRLCGISIQIVSSSSPYRKAVLTASARDLSQLPLQGKPAANHTKLQERTCRCCRRNSKFCLRQLDSIVF